MTGVVPIAGGDNPSEETYLHYRSYKKKRVWPKWPLILGGLIVGLMLPWLGFEAPNGDSEETIAVPTANVANLEFKTGQPGQLFLNGRAFGRISPGESVPLAPGSADIEWLDASGKKHRYKLVVEKGSVCILNDKTVACEVGAQ